MFQTIGGLVPDPESPGFKHFTIRPIPGEALTQAEMAYQSLHGPIISRWMLQDGSFNLEVEVPVNTTATIVLPTRDADGVMEGGRAAMASPGVVSVGVTNGASSFQVGSGRYSFAFSLNPVK
jgi:alpha-L-rhamnosidase